MSFKFFKLRSLPEPDECELLAQHGLEIRQMLPVLGPLFGLAVISFGLWDYWIDSAHASTTVSVRILLVLIGSVAYMPTRLHWTPVQRCGYIYGTHASAIIICEFLLKDGFLYGIAGIVACVFTVSVVTLRLRTFLLILSIPSLMFVVLSAISTPLLGFVNNLMLYLFSVSLACIVMLVIRTFRQRAFLFERKLLNIARHDSLTGACNRSYLTELAEREFALAERHGRTLAVAMIDIDYFKQVNDTYGHDTGDKVIQALVDTCIENLRVIDHFGRLGGEEFACILPETGESEAMLCAERLRRSIEAIRLETPHGRIQFTVSIGVAVRDASRADWSSLLRHADLALYRAKREGRNRVVLATHETSISHRIVRPTAPLMN